MPRFWVRHTMPLMVEVDTESATVTRVVTLPAEAIPMLDEHQSVMVYTPGFTRAPDAETLAPMIGSPCWAHRHLHDGPPLNWPATEEWQEDFDVYRAKRPHEPASIRHDPHSRLAPRAA